MEQPEQQTSNDIVGNRHYVGTTLANTLFCRANAVREMANEGQQMMGPWSVYERDGNGMVEWWRHPDLPSAVNRYQAVESGFITIFIGSTVDYKVEIMIHDADQMGADNLHLWRTDMMIVAGMNKAHHATIFSDYVAQATAIVQQQAAGSEGGAAGGGGGGGGAGGAGAGEVSVQTDDGAAEDPDDLAAADTVERLMKQAADAEAERDEALEKLAVEPDHNENILAAIRAGWIIPNYFEQEHFDEMEDWDQDRLNQFQSYLERVVCGGDDFVRQGIQEALENFIVQDTGDEPQYQEPCWNCPDGNILHINMGITCIKCISTGEEHTVCIHCWHGGFEDDDDWVDMDASSDEDSDAE